MKTKILLVVFFVSVSVCVSCSGRADDSHKDDSLIVSPVDVSQLKILSPSLNETWEPGKTLIIKWFFPREISLVKITIFRKRDMTQQITVKTENSGSFEWKIPQNFRNSVHYRINIAAYDNPNINIFSDYFFIIGQP